MAKKRTSFKQVAKAFDKLGEGPKRLSLRAYLRVHPETLCWEQSAAYVRRGGLRVSVNGDPAGLRHTLWHLAGHRELPKHQRMSMACRNRLCHNPSHAYIPKSTSGKRSAQPTMRIGFNFESQVEVARRYLERVGFKEVDRSPGIGDFRVMPKRSSSCKRKTRGWLWEFRWKVPGVKFGPMPEMGLFLATEESVLLAVQVEEDGRRALEGARRAS